MYISKTTNILKYNLMQKKYSTQIQLKKKEQLLF